MASGQLSAVQPRRGRRLRAMQRREHQSMATALAAAVHHSAGSREKKVELQQNAAARGQNTGAGEVRRSRRTKLHRDRSHLTREARPGILAEPRRQ